MVDLLGPTRPARHCRAVAGAGGPNPRWTGSRRLIASLNDKFGLGLGEADKVWFEQQKVAVGTDPGMRLIALNNDKRQYQIALEHKAKDLVVERQEANGTLFDAFFTNPEFQVRLLDYLATTYKDFRAGA